MQNEESNLNVSLRLYPGPGKIVDNLLFKAFLIREAINKSKTEEEKKAAIKAREDLETSVLDLSTLELTQVPTLINLLPNLNLTSIAHSSPEVKASFIDNYLEIVTWDETRSSLNILKNKILNDAKTLKIDYTPSMFAYLPLLPDLQILEINDKVYSQIDLSHLPNLRELYANNYDLSLIKGIETLKKLTTLQFNHCTNWNVIKELPSLTHLKVTKNLDSPTHLQVTQNHEHKTLYNFLSVDQIDNHDQAADTYFTLNQCRLGI